MQHKDAFFRNLHSIRLHWLVYFRDYLVYLIDYGLNDLVIECEIVISFIDRVRSTELEAGLSDIILSLITSRPSNVRKDYFFNLIEDLGPLDVILEYFHCTLYLSVRLVDGIILWINYVVQIILHFRYCFVSDLKNTLGILSSFNARIILL